MCNCQIFINLIKNSFTINEIESFEARKFKYSASKEFKKILRNYNTFEYPTINHYLRENLENPKAFLDAFNNCNCDKKLHSRDSSFEMNFPENF